jgi:tryptophan-rich hypothetical protein
MMNKINPRKLLRSKWTAVTPRNREKHFIVTRVKFAEDGSVNECLIEAVHSGREEMIDWKTLRVRDNWLQGWL